MVATDEDIQISFETNIQDRSNDRSSENSASSPCAIKLGARINVMDVISDAIAIKNSLLRCAEVCKARIHRGFFSVALTFCRCMKGILRKTRQLRELKMQKMKLGELVQVPSIPHL